MTNLTEKKYNIGYAIINTISFGNGDKNLVLLPGWPLSSRIYQVLEKYLSDDYKVVGIDLPGWSGNSEFKIKFGFKVKDHLKIIRDSLDTIFPEENRINVGGVSVGGTLAILTAYDYSEKIGKVFVQSAPYQGKYLTKTHKFETFFMNCARFVPGLASILKIFYMGPKFLEYKNNKYVIDENLGNQLNEEFKKLDSKCVLDFATDFFNNDYSEIFSKVPNEVIVVGCKKDNLVPSKMGLSLSNILPNSKYYEVEDGDHYLVAKKPEEIAKIIRENI
jgi:pimeloyl-ACP methyl ester carboxylesterase